jgi:putative polyhydroxyalkanoate system protein
MTKPISIDLPHRLGADEARRRMTGGIGKLRDHIPGGAEVQSDWQGDRMNLLVRAMGQEVSGHIDVFDDKVRLEMLLPPMLALFAGKVEGLLKKQGTEMLEDKRKA